MRALARPRGLRVRAGERCSSSLDELAAELQKQAERSEGLARLRERALALAERGERWRSGVDDERVRWVELFGHALHLNSTPLSIAEIFGQPDRGATRAPGSSRRRRCR